MSTVLVLNASFEPLHTVSVKHAMNMLWRGVAEVQEHDPARSFGPFAYPTVLRLVRYVKMSWTYTRRSIPGGKVTEKSVKDTWTDFTGGVPTFSFPGVIRRDNGQCAYCGLPFPGSMTVDHVLPRFQGGPSTWENCVAACEVCNWEKADRTPEQAGMPLLWTPFVPSRADLAY